jgi:hypothetical protein
MRFKSPPSSFESWLEQEALRLKQAAASLPPSTERDRLLRKSRQVKVAAHLNQWLTSPGLQPPQGR